MLSFETMCRMAEIERSSWRGAVITSELPDEISEAVQDEVYAGAKAFASENKDCRWLGGYIYS